MCSKLTCNDSKHIQFYFAHSFYFIFPKHCTVQAGGEEEREGNKKSFFIFAMISWAAMSPTTLVLDFF